ncbi:hypothetical protein D1007_56772 [Hordeum vulgare]|nr:hypothetical protein D1007_56772 [Hordeum vulgare]
MPAGAHHHLSRGTRPRRPPRRPPSQATLSLSGFSRPLLPHRHVLPVALAGLRPQPQPRSATTPPAVHGHFTAVGPGVVPYFPTGSAPHRPRRPMAPAPSPQSPPPFPALLPPPATSPSSPAAAPARTGIVDGGKEARHAGSQACYTTPPFL